jgi:hypothetical protein
LLLFEVSLSCAGDTSFGAGCWPGLLLTTGGSLNIDTLLIGPAVIQGGSLSYTASTITLSSFTRDAAAVDVVVGRLLVAAGTNTFLIFLSPGTYVTYAEIEVIALLRV